MAMPPLWRCSILSIYTLLYFRECSLLSKIEECILEFPSTCSLFPFNLLLRRLSHPQGWDGFRQVDLTSTRDFCNRQKPEMQLSYVGPMVQDIERGPSWALFLHLGKLAPLMVLICQRLEATWVFLPQPWLLLLFETKPHKQWLCITNNYTHTSHT
jgi:hypothetical protein